MPTKKSSTKKTDKDLEATRGSANLAEVKGAIKALKDAGIQLVECPHCEEVSFISK